MIGKVATKEKKRKKRKELSLGEDASGIIEKLKEKLAAEEVKVDYELHDDYRLAGFLVGAGFDLDKAFHNFTHSLVPSPVVLPNSRQMVVK